ncbi:MAG: queuosine precursor transporter [Pirellulaceae bacterium]
MTNIETNKRLHPIEASHLHARRERVFLVLAGLFLGSMTMLNILGISRFIKLATWNYELASGETWPIHFAIAIGVLPYPITFLCTDFISEFYGRTRANWVVFVGLLLNIWIVFILWLGGELPGFETIVDGRPVNEDGTTPVFFQIRALSFGAVGASMAAYLAAQFCDVYMFHFWKRKTKGKHLWLRNNGSTIVSQLVDTVAVILITHFATGTLPINSNIPVWIQLVTFIATGYSFKFAFALLDTIPFYIGVHYLQRYLQFDPLTSDAE